MSKLKLLYDVISIMKEKEVVSGIFQAEVKKDQLQVVNFTNEFEKNLTSGETKVNISTELDCDGKKVKHESHTEFTMQNCCSGHMHHGFMKHMHHIHHNNCQNNGNVKCGGIKGKLTKLAFVLSIFNQIKVDEKDDKSVILSLSLNDIPDDIKKVFQERLSQGKTPEHHQHHVCIKELCTLKDPKIELKVWIKKTREIEKLILTVDGKQINELNENHELSLSAELRLT